MVDDTHAPVAAATAGQYRRVLTETETRVDCHCGTGYSLSDRSMLCEHCHGIGNLWQVTSRTVQVGSTFEEQAAYAIIQSLRAHIRMCAQTMEDMATDYERLGHPKQGAKARASAKRALEPLEGQD